MVITNQYVGNHQNVDSTLISIGTKNLSYSYNMDETLNAKLNQIKIQECLANEDISTTRDIFVNKIEYDKLGRTSEIRLNNFIKQYHYLKSGDHASNLVSSVWYGKDNIICENFRYKYDEKGNIIEIKHNNNLVARYTYDSLSRLIREDNSELGKTTTFEYDGGGNIVDKVEYAYTLCDSDKLTDGTPCAYLYKANGWKDQLVSYNGEVCKDYDSLGNPTLYRNHNLVWSHARQLDRFGDIASYEYNANGIRISKTINGVKTKYYLNGNKIIAQDNGNKLFFHYGVDGIIGFTLKLSDTVEQEYTYKKNILGDIIGIYDSNDKLICKYIYDAWGNHNTCILYQNANNIEKYVDLNDEEEYNKLSEDEKTIVDYRIFIATLNPFRYRGYYYDTETGLYYLNSRYYDPETGRFINADHVSVLQLAQNQINGLNLYSYCFNNFVNETDYTGNFLDSYSEIVDFISTILITGLNLGFASAGWAIKTGVRPSNIGIGTFAKNQKTQLNSLSKASNIVSKISTVVTIITVGLSVIDSINADINRGYSTDRIISNAIVNTGIYTGSAFVAGFIGTKIGALIGTAIPIPGLGTAVGAVIGFVVGLGINEILNIQINGKPIIDHIRDGVYYLGSKIKEGFNNTVNKVKSFFRRVFG